MTTDTAVRTTRIVIQDKGKFRVSVGQADLRLSGTFHAVPLSEIPYIDNPELKINKHESSEMPFRYVKDESGRPIMPDVSTNSFYHISNTLTQRTGHDRSDQKRLREGIRRASMTKKHTIIRTNKFNFTRSNPLPKNYLKIIRYAKWMYA